MGYQEKNIQTIERWIEEGWRWGIPIDHETFERAKQGDFQMLLTPTRPIPHTWLGNLKGKKVLGLAAGGGQQMALCAAKGAKCTVLDYSAKQLEADAIVAKREGYEITLVQADMTKPLPFEDESFDLIIHPVSNCYIEEVLPLWKECHRVLKPGGRLLSGLDIGTNYIVDENEERVINHLPSIRFATPNKPLNWNNKMAAFNSATPSTNNFGANCKWDSPSSIYSKTITEKADWPNFIFLLSWPLTRKNNPVLRLFFAICKENKRVFVTGFKTTIGEFFRMEAHIESQLGGKADEIRPKE